MAEETVNASDIAHLGPADLDRVVAETLALGVSAGVLLHGVNEAISEISRPAALTMAQGLVPSSLAAMLGKLGSLKEAVQRAQEKQARTPPRRVIIEAPAAGETSVA